MTKYIKLFSIIFILTALVSAVALGIGSFMVPAASLDVRIYIGILALIPFAVAFVSTIAWFCLDKSFNKSA